MFQSHPSVATVAHRARKPMVGLVAAVAVASLIGSSSTPGLVTVADSELLVSPGDRVLQSVEVAMGPDGTLTAVEGTTVTASADGESAESTTQAYSPDDVVGDLPVRVLTSYRTDDGSGSDLSELEGYDGQVRIDLTVQNLTVEAQDVSYDVAGASRTRPALVGAPLTVVAAADLGGTDPARVVTQAAGEDSVTNGVLSQGADGATQVQWATILAPPQLSSSATLSLVVDAKDFSAPAFDLSVQPGLVTDPSVGALVENAFNPAASEELALQARTVEIVGEVNELLAEAGDSISDVRRSLTSTTETLGLRTVGDLASSITRIAASMEALDGSVLGLGKGVSTALEATGSSSLAQLESTVASVDSLLGDTTGKPGTATVAGSGCETTVRTGTGGGSVYDSLLRVAGTLNGYASASDSCKQALQTSLVNSIGPPVDELSDAEVARVCAPSTPTQPNAAAGSVTCVLSRTGDRLPTQIAESLAASEELALGTLDSTGVARVIIQMNELNRVLDGVEQTPGLLVALRALRDRDGGELDLDALRTELEALGSLRADFAAVAADLGTGAGGVTTELDTIEGRDQMVYRTLCTIADNPVEPVAAVQAREAAARIAPGVRCEAPYELPDSPQVDSARDALAALVDSTGGTLKTALDDFDDQYAATLATLSTVEGGEGVEKGQLRDFFRQIDLLNDERLDVKAEVDTLNDLEDEARAAISDAFTEAESDAGDAIRSGTQSSIKAVSKRSAAAQKEVAEAFARSKDGMRDAASGIAADGRAAIDEQKGGLAKTSQEATGVIESNVRAGLDVIAVTVSASTRDTDAAGKLLAADLTKVLLDLGDPEVDGAGLLGTLGANAGDSRAADFQLALATRTASSYANARGQDIGGLMLRQAQAEAAFKRQAQLEAFQVDVPDGVERRTVYSFHLAAGQ